MRVVWAIRSQSWGCRARVARLAALIDAEHLVVTRHGDDSPLGALRVQRCDSAKGYDEALDAAATGAVLVQMGAEFNATDPLLAFAGVRRAVAVSAAAVLVSSTPPAPPPDLFDVVIENGWRPYSEAPTPEPRRSGRRVAWEPPRPGAPHVVSVPPILSMPVEEAIAQADRSEGGGIVGVGSAWSPQSQALRAVVHRLGGRWVERWPAMPHMAPADVVVGPAGQTLAAECAALGVRSVLVPLGGSDHDRYANGALDTIAADVEWALTLPPPDASGVDGAEQAAAAIAQEVR